LFGYTNAWTSAPQSTFGVLFLVTLLAAIWMQFTVMRIVQQKSPEMKHEFDHMSPEASKADAPAPLVSATTSTNTTKGDQQ
jgi:NNP family nitrate/nitrite transporter-like MFS transporter